MARKKRGGVAEHVERRDAVQRIFVEAGSFARFGALALELLAVPDRGDEKKRAGQQIPGTRKNPRGVRERRGRRRQKCCARQIRGKQNDQQRAGSFAARLPRGRHITIDRDRRQQHHREQNAADHPAHRHGGREGVAGLQALVEREVADGLDNSRENKTKGENQRGAVMRAAEAHQRVGGVAEADQDAADFKVEIALGGAGDAGEAQVGDQREVTERDNGIGENGQARHTGRGLLRHASNALRRRRRRVPQKPGNLGPTAHESPQMPKKAREAVTNRDKCTRTSLLGGKMTVSK